MTGKYEAVIRNADIQKLFGSTLNTSFDFIVGTYKSVTFVSKYLGAFSSLQHVTVMSC